jgi:hypothetical protein
VQLVAQVALTPAEVAEVVVLMSRQQAQAVAEL